MNEVKEYTYKLVEDDENVEPNQEETVHSTNEEAGDEGIHKHFFKSVGSVA
jgi:hypothetical protein